ncbi:DUF3047 domain-containing protein [Amphibiibacter pelophylacis]|uniref:DUF3047 domain-containing protein n=1 Tax=Amphibiibacter pelophylacis TaxID=1799477 RepID=A0ACC6NYV2_9BURK
MLKASLILLSLLPAAAQAVDVGRFKESSGAPPAPWRLQTLNDKLAPTHYALRDWDGVNAIEAKAKASMALMARPLSVDLAKTPVLCWRWRVDAPLKNADLRTKEGDDYAARVYITFKIKPEALDFATRAKLRIGRAIFGDQLPDAAINYVWDNRYPVGTREPSAYTDRVRLIVARSGAADAGHWVDERHDVLADATQAFGPDIAAARQLAVASDTDNTGEEAHAGFADLHFVARDAPCVF